MALRQKFLRYLLFALTINVCDAEVFASQTQAIFDLHNGFWVNLHHFLFTAAQTSSGTVTRPREDAIDVKELEFLSDSERQGWNTALSYYATALVHRDLLMDSEMEEIKNELEDSENSPDLKDAKLAPELRSILLMVAPIYRKHWWPRHEALNRDWISALQPLVARYGNSLTLSLAKIYDVPWPPQPIRVDTVAYANWAGAYTTLYPTRPTISSLDPANQGAAALEMVFHESSHAMMDPVLSSIDSAKRNAVADHRRVSVRRDLWHEVLFYTSGELVAELVPDYVPYADKNSLWDRAWTRADRKAIERQWKPHMQGSVPLEESLTKLVNDLSVTSELRNSQR